jgi:hypothetical protein
MAKGTTFMDKASEGWKAVQAGGGTVAQRDTKADVVSRPSGLPRAEETGSVKIKAANGRIQRSEPTLTVTILAGPRVSP